VRVESYDEIVAAKEARGTAVTAMESAVRFQQLRKTLSRSSRRPQSTLLQHESFLARLARGIARAMPLLVFVHSTVQPIRPQ